MMQDWFKTAKLGIFIHYGIYAVKGVRESWSFWDGEISNEDYFSQLQGFTARNYDPQAWAKLFRKAGARYAVLTAKHHDGVALFDTTLNELSVVKKTPASRDLIAPYCQALRQEGLKVGLYFSHLDWSHSDYPSLRLPSLAAEAKINRYSQAEHGKEDPQAWERFLMFHRGQLQELCTRYGLVDLMWFDGDWERTSQQWRMAELRELLHKWQPNMIINSRMGREQNYGDYATPEQGVPILPPQGPWEFCMTINDSWGYQGRDRNYKSPRQIIRVFTECISMGGNLLLDVGPMEDGTIPPEQVQRLEELGTWISRNSEAVYETAAGLPAGHFYGASTVSLDGKTLYLMLYDRPWESVALKGVCSKVRRVSELASGRELSFKGIGGAAWNRIPPVVWIDVPEAVLNPYATVLKVELEEPLKLYRGRGGAIEQN